MQYIMIIFKPKLRTRFYLSAKKLPLLDKSSNPPDFPKVAWRYEILIFLRKHLCFHKETKGNQNDAYDQMFLRSKK
jgi:hypothetical protein